MENKNKSKERKWYDRIKISNMKITPARIYLFILAVLLTVKIVLIFTVLVILFQNPCRLFCLFSVTLLSVQLLHLFLTLTGAFGKTEY